MASITLAASKEPKQSKSDPPITRISAQLCVRDHTPSAMQLCPGPYGCDYSVCNLHRISPLHQNLRPSYECLSTFLVTRMLFFSYLARGNGEDLGSHNFDFGHVLDQVGTAGDLKPSSTTRNVVLDSTGLELTKAG